MKYYTEFCVNDLTLKTQGFQKDSGSLYRTLLNFFKDNHLEITWLCR